MPEKRRKTENATNPAQHQRGEKLFLRRIGCQKKILTWRCHLRLKCLYSRTHMGNVGLDKCLQRILFSLTSRSPP